MIDVVSLILAKRRGELSREERIRRLREQYLADPTKAQKLIAAIMTQHVPPERKIRKRKYPTVLEAVEAAIPRSDPRRGMGRAIWETYNKMMVNPEFRDYSPPELIAAAHEVELGKRREAVHEHAWEQKRGTFRNWPVIGAEPVAPLPDQEAWEQQRAERPRTPAEVSAAIGGGFSLAGQLFRRWLAKRAVAAGAAAVVPEISVPATLIAAGMAIPEFYVWDKLEEAIRSTEWAKKHPHQATAATLALGTGLLVFGPRIGKQAARGLFGRLEKATRVADEAAEKVAVSPTVENLLKHDRAKKKLFEEGELAARVLGPPKVRAPLLDMLAEAMEARRPKLPVPVEPPKGPSGPVLISPYGVSKTGRQFAKYAFAGPGEEPRRYTFKNITNVEEVFKKIAQGKSKEEALQEVGKAEALLKKQAERPRISKEVRYELKRMGYTSQDIKQMTPEGVRVITRLVEAKKKGEDMGKVMKELADVVGVEKPKIEPPPGASTKELYEWAKGLSPQERYDLVERGKLPHSVVKKIAAEEKAKAKLPETEPSLEREPTPEELKESEEFLQSLGNIDGTVPGPDGKLKPAKAAEHARKLKGADKLLLGIVAASTLVPLAEVLGPTEAEAAGPETMVTELAAAVLKGARREGPKTLQKMLKALREAHIIPPPQTDPFTLPEPMRAIRLVPSLDLIQKKANMPLQGLATPHSYFWYYFGVKEGQELMANPAVQWASAQTAAIYNTTVGQKTLLRILNEIPGYKSSANELIEAMRPLMQKYYEPMQIRGYHAYMADKLKKAIDKEWARATKRKLVGEEKEKALSIIEALEEQYRAHTRELEKTAHIVDEYHEAWRRIVQPMSLQPQHIGLRVFLAAEDTADFIHYPWLKGRLSFDEQVAVARLKAMMEHYGARLLEAGEEIITHRPYMHHAPHPDANFERVEEAIKRFGRGVVPTPPLAKVFSRKAGFLPMVPDAEYCTTRYIQDINLRLEAMNFWRKGKPDGWWAFQQAIEANPGIAPEGLVRAFRAFARGFKPVESTPLNNLSNKLYAFEVARLLWMSPSVALKHLFKVLAGYRTFGLEAVKATPKALVSTVKIAIKRQGGEAWLKKMGWSLDVMDEAVEALTETGKLYRMIAEISPFMATESQAAKLLRRFNEMGSLPVSAVERFDRALSVVTALRMAAKKGMTPWQATYGVFDTILKANFLAGPLNPAWLRDPKIRLVMAFQGTPYKIMEQRAMLYSRAGGALLEVVKQLAKDIREGEMRFKWAMIKDALSRERDIFGTPVLKQALTEMLLVGTAIEIGKQAWDVELAHHFLHPPFVRVHRREVAIGASPLVGATVRALMAPEEIKEEEFIVSRFFNEWFGRANRGLPLPATFVKLARLSKDDIPEIYRDRRLAYLFSVPTLE